MKIVWTEPAARALESIQDFIAKNNRRAALGSGPEDKDKTDGDSAKGSSKIGKGGSCAWHL